MWAESYTGDGNATKAITEVGFRPKVVIVQGDHGSLSNGQTTIGTGNAIYRTDTMVKARNVTGGHETDGILSLDAQGFTVMRDTPNCCGVTNEDDETYYYYAFGGRGIETGTHFGNPVEDPHEVPVALTPAMVWVGSPSSIYFRTRLMGAEDLDFHGLPPEADRIKSLSASGFTLGTDTAVNAPSVLYHYVAFQDSTNMHLGSYDGDVQPLPRQVLPLIPMAFDPDLVHIKGHLPQLATSHAVWTTSSLAEDATLRYAGGPHVTNRILSLTPAPGQFEVGPESEVNRSGAISEVTYYFFALEETAPP